MRVLVTSQPAFGHFLPMAPLLTALVDDGHELVVATSKRFGPVVESFGLAFVPAGLDWQESEMFEAFPDVADFVGDMDVGMVRFVVDVMVRRTSQAMATDTAALIKQVRPDVLVHSSSEFGGPAAAEAAGVPHVMVLAGIDNWFDRLAPALAGCDEARVAVGLDPALGTSGWLFAAGVVVAEAPGWSGHPMKGIDVLWLAPTPLTQPRLDLNWLDDLPRPIVHVTLGTVFNTVFRRLFKPLAVGAAERAGSVVMTIGDDLDPSRFAALPANVHVRRYVPLDAVLQRADGAISHGGWGTLTACASAGVPLAALVLGAEHSYNAAIAQRAEFGFGLNPLNFDQSAATQATGRLLSDPVLRSNAAAQAAIVRDLPSPRETASNFAHRFG